MPDKSYDIMCVGHVTNDFLVRGQERIRFTGGGAFFGAFSAHHSGADVLVLTKLAANDLHLIDALKKEGIDVAVRPSANTTSIENFYLQDRPDQREVTLLAQGDAFTIEDIPPVQADVYHLTALFRGEIPEDLITTLAQRGRIALDLQGILRTSDKTGFRWQDWAEKKRYLPLIDFLKADSLEAEVITGTADLLAAAKLLNTWGAGEVLLTHEEGVLLGDGNHVYSAPFNPDNLSGRTGRGDTCCAAYLARRLSRGIEASLGYAAALTSIKMERPGPFTGSIRQVEKRAARIDCTRLA